MMLERNLVPIFLPTDSQSDYQKDKREKEEENVLNRISLSESTKTVDGPRAMIFLCVIIILC